MPRKHLPPAAAALMQSIRGVGYDVRTAIADLVDNSIAAQASEVEVSFLWNGRESVVTLVDDGRGMTPDQLDLAMTLGSRNPNEIRDSTDLGRFGLGLKTASLSQCSRLLVATKPADGALSVAVWDLAMVADANEWIISDDVLPEEAPHVEALRARPHGSLVLWNRLDRLVGDASPTDESARMHFQRTARDVEGHLAMVFHRLLEGRNPRLRIFVNGHTDEQRVRPWDPFCLSNSATQIFGEARRSTRDGTISLQGFALPHRDRFDTADAFEIAGGPAGWTNQQGFYVYRNQRLLVAGSWLSLGNPRRWTRDEQHKLARIQLDLPNTIDAAWKIDIKKSKAEPPIALRDWLTRNAESIRSEAKQVFVHRGNRHSARAQSTFCPVWFAEAGGAPRYRINREHPAIAFLLQQGTKAVGEQALRLLETTVPIHRIWLDVAEKPEVPAPARQQLSETEVGAAARSLVERLMQGHSLTRAAAIQRIRNLEPFDQFPDLIEALSTQ